ncbi:MAG TPA: hypothetical protein VK680_06995 [Solirubrobacteraceae bacterium]|jgi:hypothetical protein|nr:hypothetical protein [Solirubrobacteraceae bacterium]
MTSKHFRATAGRAVSVIAGLALSFGVLFTSAPTPAFAEGGCPNEQLRAETHSTGLPDCRAYELVSPASKDGEPVTRGRVAAGGSSIAFTSLGAFGQLEKNSTSEGGTYVDTRGVSGWSALAVNPPAKQFRLKSPFTFFVASEAGETTDFTPDLSDTLFAQTPVSSEPLDGRLYLRQDSDGSFVEIGPLASPAEIAALTESDEERGESPIETYAGATHDLSHVFFTQNQQAVPGRRPWYWPGDATVAGTSLYEYVGTGNAEPDLVGVASGPEEAKDRPAEDPTLVSQCGTALGGGARASSPIREVADSYNAISTLPVSEEGRTVFFTAMALGPGCEGTKGPPVNELYARIGGAETVAISEPSSADCAACALASPRRALFQGASADGSKAFFLSEQELLPQAKAGTNLYEYDFNAADPHEKLTVVATDLAPAEGAMAGVARVANDGSRVYLVSTGVLAHNIDANGDEAKEGEDNLYVYDTETRESTFIAALSPNDAEDWQSTVDGRPVEATPDGRFLIFTSAGNLTPDASGTGSQLYRYDAQSRELVRVSVGEHGFNDDGNDGASSGIAAADYLGVDQAGPQPVSISADGSKVFFRSTGGLTPQAQNEACAVEEAGVCTVTEENIYEWEEGHVYLLSDGQDTHSILGGQAVGLIGASASGSDVFFTTVDPLVGQDTDTQVDIYDARIDGGFPAPTAPAGCQGEACQGAAAAQPAFASPASATIAGAGNLVPLPSSKPGKTAAQLRVQRLAKALKACRSKRNRHKRLVCESTARKRYGPKAKRSAHLKRGAAR